MRRPSIGVMLGPVRPEKVRSHARQVERSGSLVLATAAAVSGARALMV
jgi:hypothetical protein